MKGIAASFIRKHILSNYGCAFWGPVPHPPTRFDLSTLFDRFKDQSSVGSRIGEDE